MSLEVIVIPVAEVDRALRFYRSLGWRIDADYEATRSSDRTGDATGVPSSGSGTRAAPSCLALAYGEGGDVVVKASSAVAQEIAVKSREQFAGRCRGLPAHPSCQGEEIAVAGAGLGDPVGIQKQQVAGGEVEGVDVVVIADQLREVEQWRRRG